MAVTKGVLLLLLYISHTSAKCGIQNVNIQETSEESLVGGQEFPWVVSLQDPQYTHLAFGCVLSEFWILSIASAFQNRKEAVAIVGIARMDSKEVSHEEFPVSFIVPHEDFDNSTMDNNIALLKTDTAMAFTSLVRPICFLNKGTAASPHLRNCWVAGWNPTTATGNHMTMSILRKITVRDMEPCPLNHSRKLRCGNHIERETNSVCLGDPGNPVMCQMQQVNLWVLRGLLSPGGEKCPGLFLYTRIDEYGAWIEAKTKGTASALTSFHQWDHFVPSPSFSSRAPAAQKKFPGLARMMGSQTQPRSLKSVTRPSWSANDSSRSIQDRDKGFKPAIQPMYYDYYGGVEGGRWSTSGRGRLRPRPELLLLCSRLAVLGAGV
ncbi:inactive serine protease 54 [Sorex araneus]|uniref:inactive serine protease 54 n=1 Tax=Sorex araneus TaxID=42254 RepID=UPI00064AD1D0|nr:inactive serine protease 54 [Sorex araneus]